MKTPLQTLIEAATPLPLEISTDQNGDCDICAGYAGDMVADLKGCANAKANAQLLTHCANHFVELVEALKEAAIQIDYMQEKFQKTGTGNATMAKIEAVLERAENVEI